jgi:NADPH2:quinone reductase
VLHAYGDPSYGTFADPEPAAGELRLEVRAAGLNHLDLAIASGRFYARTPALPSVVGIDGVGVDRDGRRVYFDEPVAPFGSLAELVLVRADGVLPVDDAVDDRTAAALGNAGVAAMLALTRHGRLAPGERVLVLGGTGAVGQLAVQVARELGASRVVGVGRDAARLARLRDLGADATLTLDEAADPELVREAAGGPVDVVVDTLWGQPMLDALPATALGARLVQLGQKAGAVAAVPAAALRARLLTVIGSSGVLEPHAARAEAYARLMALARTGALQVATEAVPLSRVEEAWARQRAGAPTKLVVVPDALPG